MRALGQRHQRLRRMQHGWGRNTDQINGVTVQHGMPVIIDVWDAKLVSRRLRTCQPARGNGHHFGTIDMPKGRQIGRLRKTCPDDCNFHHVVSLFSVANSTGPACPLQLRSFSLGSRKSRNQSPMMLNESTVKTMARPGKIASHHLLAIN